MHKILVKCNHNPLIGRIQINGSKNAVLPIMAASLLSNSPVTLYNAPDLIDVHLMSKLLEDLGAKVNFVYNKNYKANHILEIDCSSVSNHVMSFEVVSKLRASLVMLGPMLSRFGKVKTTLPGGCNIGKRPIDAHVSALETMGAEIEIDGNNITAAAKGKLKGKKIIFEKVSVGATENIIMAATLADGVTIIENSAIEPEVLDLVRFLKKMGAKIEIEDTRITITGVEVLSGCCHTIIPDRIEAGTYALAAIVTDGKLELEGINLSDIGCIANELQYMDASVESRNSSLVISRRNCSIKPIQVATNPYPNFPSDMQPQLMSAMSIADGVSVIEENIFESRFTHVTELKKLGARISIEENIATISGVKSLSHANLYATDLRSTAALIIASLVAGGETIINNAHHLCRGYEAMLEKLNSCGAILS
ncbi:UDP-N-acetylglucosamine 1-carboxyvinyltransferase [Wolbachia endosymbiont of Ctenocephalides felis wCfeT]|uniref:UDP-N-acetylglucosamine 1-carboxyvinyltransferase n=1 Tax=Wolbachia endosymbiont of Ctenocephalides felis wCfeT TaxID=2732593 RepID=UPI0014466049|nr:UDP-N-acetylglucosamine 1-carboxyvinyltransferase [Wolbachia endosymbiont of Ctenocephalides felis wCfeT]